MLEKFFRTFVVQAGGEDKALYEVLKKLARAAMNQENPVEVSTLFNGTRTDPTLRGSITNISENNFTPEGITYGVLHGMIKELYDMYQQIHQGTGIQVSHLVASGNGMRKNKVLQEISSEMVWGRFIIGCVPGRGSLWSCSQQCYGFLSCITHIISKGIVYV